MVSRVLHKACISEGTLLARCLLHLLGQADRHALLPIQLCTTVCLCLGGLQGITEQKQTQRIPEVSLARAGVHQATRDT